MCNACWPARKLLWAARVVRTTSFQFESNMSETAFRAVILLNAWADWCELFFVREMRFGSGWRLRGAIQRWGAESAEFSGQKSFRGRPHGSPLPCLSWRPESEPRKMRRAGHVWYSTKPSFGLEVRVRCITQVLLDTFQAWRQRKTRRPRKRFLTYPHS